TFFSLLIIVLCCLLADGVKLCHRSDPNFEKCVATNMEDALKNYFADGYKEAGLPKLEPFFVQKLEIAGEPSQSVSLHQKYQNVYVYGSVNSHFKNLKIELDKGCSWQVDAVSPAVTMNADYEIKGQLLVFPINSHGKCNITQFNLVNHHTMACEKYTKNNDTYIRVVDYAMDMRPEKITYDFGNVFPGNEEISNQIVRTLNENSKSIFDEVKPGIEKAFFSGLQAIYERCVFQDTAGRAVPGLVAEIFLTKFFVN
ncbi:hypothetical protein NQ315_002359, partial [Exocentrus adspersus]